MSWADDVAIKASSKSLRKATRKVAEALTDGPPPVTPKPSADFDDVLDLARESSDRRALEWYRRGLVRGIAQATDWLINGTIDFDDGVLTANAKFTVKRPIKLKGRPRTTKTFNIKSSEVGFK
jgi:hypothetical protein